MLGVGREWCGRDLVTLVALYILHVSTGKMLEMRTDAAVYAAVVLVGTCPFFPETWSKETSVSISLGDCSPRNSVAMAAGMIGIDRCALSPGTAGFTAVTGGV